MKALIDGDVVVYQASSQASRRYYTIDGWKRHYKYIAKAREFCDKKDLPHTAIQRNVVPTCTPSKCLEITEKFVHQIAQNSEANDLRVFLSDENNFRQTVATTAKYKGNREGGWGRPPYYQLVRDFLLSEFNAVIEPDHEADDLLGIHQDKINYGSVICSIDKDLLMIPGHHYNWRHNEHTFVEPYDGMRTFWKQMLTGDNVDNIIGIRGIGPVKADELLPHGLTEDEMRCAVGLEYAKAFDDPEYRMVENGQLLWIKQDMDDVWTLE